ncbi:RagB/SusD family nutrient uptake outer membrane protein [Sphingobacterium sp. DR205]|uniref:RagB/SusD family nutrient uptake outer membrane protein n=1 Tax=Sphingobacterium sp. DR205 TaxID=2713573 RepID=UPI0013E52386|nr:RagB/SusD family nutrient uptake outer membrane protein [Sphingobacterium sp. DR205]QIH35624.1 RagB/SusD family nutrient uptake outer membrane protein [Sphingobacterium sp. DR205]
MKKHTYLLFFVLVGLLPACQKDLLDKNPKDAYSNSSLWSSEADAQAALNGVYSGWDDNYQILYMDAISDNAYSQYYWEGYTSLGNGSASPSDPYGTDRWSPAYSAIQKCNWFLQNVDQTPMDEAKKTQMKAEARFLRAYQYYTLTQLYGDVPLTTKTLSLEEANVINKTSITEVQQFVLDELGAIAPELPVSYSGNEVGKITRGAALSLKARLELYTARYADCITTSEQIMALGYSLFSSYADLFRIQNENNREVILDIQYRANDHPNSNLGVMPSSTFGGWGSLCPTQALVDSYEMNNGKTIAELNSGYDEKEPYKNRDPRLSASIVFPGQLYEGKYYNPIESNSGDYYNGGNNSKTGYLYKKFTSDLSDYDDIWNTGLNMIVIRYAEVLLTYAEAKIETGAIDNSVYDAIDAVRQRAGMPKVNRSVYAGQTAMRELVRRERRVEFALEGLRWFDIKRWKIGPQVREGKVYGTRLGKVDPKTGALTLSGDHVEAESRTFDAGRDYLWPIPRKETDVNNNLGQNPGYPN